jgi:ABC-type polysaccharide/polyol phosphate export permease
MIPKYLDMVMWFVHDYENTCSYGLFTFSFMLVIVTMMVVMIINESNIVDGGPLIVCSILLIVFVILYKIIAAALWPYVRCLIRCDQCNFAFVG